MSTEPCASITAGLVKFSLAISSMFSCWRWRSCSIASAISGSTRVEAQVRRDDSGFHGSLAPCGATSLGPGTDCNSAPVMFWFSLLEKADQRGYALLDLIATLQIHIIRAADRIADVLFKYVERFVKFAQ